MLGFIVKTIIYLDVIIKLLFIACLILWIITPIYALKMDNFKKKEVTRLRKLNDDLQSILETPINKVREAFKNEQ